MAAVDSGCEPLNVKVFQAWLLAVTRLSHVDVQVYWIKHTELGGLDPGESTNMQMYYIPRIDWEKSNVTILKVLRQFLPTSHHVKRYIYMSHNVALIPLYINQCNVFNKLLFLFFASVLAKFASEKSVLQQPPTTAGFLISNMKTSRVSGLICNELQCPQQLPWRRSCQALPRSSYVIRREMVRSFVMSVNPNMVRVELRRSLNFLVTFTNRNIFGLPPTQ